MLVGSQGFFLLEETPGRLFAEGESTLEGTRSKESGVVDQEVFSVRLRATPSVMNLSDVFEL
jgi:hypothetical protein